MEHRLNNDITARVVRLIDSNGDQVGIVELREAKSKASEQGLDLVQINESNPPVCKIMDYSKFKFEQKKKLKEAKKKQATIEIKEVQISMTIEQNDLRVKAKQVEKFLSKGNHVRVTLLMRGREISHSDIGESVMSDFLKLLTEMNIIYKLKQNIKVQGKIIECSLEPEKSKV